VIFGCVEFESGDGLSSCPRNISATAQTTRTPTKAAITLRLFLRTLSVPSCMSQFYLKGASRLNHANNVGLKAPANTACLTAIISSALRFASEKFTPLQSNDGG